MQPTKPPLDAGGGVLDARSRAVESSCRRLHLLCGQARGFREGCRTHVCFLPLSPTSLALKAGLHLSHLPLPLPLSCSAPFSVWKGVLRIEAKECCCRLACISRDEVVLCERYSASRSVGVWASGWVGMWCGCGCELCGVWVCGVWECDC